MDTSPIHSYYLKTPTPISTHSKKSRKSTSKSKKPQKDPSPSKPRIDSEVRLTDLCAEDKIRIGLLVKRLALEKSQRSETESKLFLEQKHKERQLKNLAKENEKIRAETIELKAKYEKSLEIIESYKNESFKTSWKDWPSQKSSFRITPEPVRGNFPLSPLKEVNSIGVQTVCDKEIQTSEGPKTYRESPRSEAVKEIRNLKEDLVLLSESVRNCKMASLRASQILDDKKGRISGKDLLKMTGKKNGFDEKDYNGGKQELIGDFELKGSYRQDVSSDKHQFSFREDSSVRAVKDSAFGFYDEGLFQLVDDLEKVDNKMFEFLEDEEFSEFSENSLKKEGFLDSAEELRNRALRLKNKFKY